MLIVLQQSFPLGRFHATPWRANPFTDAFGEWPPSPWRLVRAVVARWYQWQREAFAAADEGEVERLVSALCDSSYRFHLPVYARNGSPLRQYQPMELEMDPPKFKAYAAVFKSPSASLSQDLRTRLKMADAEIIEENSSTLRVRVCKSSAKKKVTQHFSEPPIEEWCGSAPDPGVRSYSTVLVQDNYWCVPRDEHGSVWWFIEGELWNDDLIATLDRCLERITYFGRAETLSHIRRSPGPWPEANCLLRDKASADSVPVLVPQASASRADIERITDDPDIANRSTPAGALRLHARVPEVLPARESGVQSPVREDCRLVQFAIGCNVPPPPRAVARLTARFRGAVLRELFRIKAGGSSTSWTDADVAVRAQVADMLGKDVKGKPLEGHRHTEFFAWLDGGRPTRLLVWRGARPFDQDEQIAIFRAASRDLSWARPGLDETDWKVRIVPLDSAVPPPPGFDGTRSVVWESVTPFVPARHHLRGGRPRESESTLNQVRRELVLRGLIEAADKVDIDEIRDAGWVSVHVPRGKKGKRAFLGDRRGYWLCLRFAEPIPGPVRLGHSSSFGLGLFRPTE
jgi:hypothetical protein